MERLLSVTRVYRGSPSHQTTTPGPTVRTAGTVTLVRGASTWGSKAAELGVEKQSAGRVGTSVASRLQQAELMLGMGHSGRRYIDAMGRMLVFQGRRKQNLRDC